LPAEKKILLYTGRFYPDKNMGTLLTLSSLLQKIIPDIRLVMSIRFKDNIYFNMFSERLQQVIIFEKMPTSNMPYLYNAADLYISCSTSYFETFGRSPLESVSCGTPVLVPDWIGYEDHINDQKGRLVPVDYIDIPSYDAMSYHMVNPAKFIENCLDLLSSPRRLNYIAVPEHISSPFILNIFRDMIDSLTTKKIMNSNKSELLKANHPIIKEVCDTMNIDSINKLFHFTTCSYEEIYHLRKSFIKKFMLVFLGFVETIYLL
jgi:glycosyltransferase involved in cell wall biosynthesis